MSLVGPDQISSAQNKKKKSLVTFAAMVAITLWSRVCRGRRGPEVGCRQDDTQLCPAALNPLEK